MAPPVALVTTAWFADVSPRHAGVLSAFLLYHAELGVAKSFVFLDGDRDTQPRVEQLHPRVRKLHAAGRVELRYRDQVDDWAAVGVESWRTLGAAAAAASDVAARQMLNAELAMRLCLQHNQRVQTHEQLRWLLHLDVDELLYLEALGERKTHTVESSQDALDTFVRTLEAQQPPMFQLTLANHEAVPTQLHGGVYFQETSTFRRHHAHVPFTREAQQALAFWRQRTRHEQFFLFYDNGKAIVRVQEGVVPASVHHWRHLQSSGNNLEETPTAAMASRSNFFDARRNIAQEDVLVEPDGQRACVLHYPVCGVEWLREKYERLGDFPDVWGGTSGEREMKIAPCFHTQARDVVVRSSECGDDEEEREREATIAEALEELYRSHVMLDASEPANALEWQRQIAAGVCEEIRFPAELLAKFEPLGGSSTGDQRSSARNLPAPPASAAAPRTPNASTRVPAAAAAMDFTIEKAWMLAAISQQYLQQDGKQ